MGGFCVVIGALTYVSSGGPKQKGPPEEQAAGISDAVKKTASDMLFLLTTTACQQLSSDAILFTGNFASREMKRRCVKEE